MNAIRIYVDENNTDKMGGIVEKLNEFEDTVATMVNETELFIAAEGPGALKYALCIVKREFSEELSTQYVK